MATTQGDQPDERAGEPAGDGGGGAAGAVAPAGGEAGAGGSSGEPASGSGGPGGPIVGDDRAIESLRLVAPVHRDDAVWKLEVMSRRGRLPGFRRVPGGFSVAAHGNPFDKTLTMRADEGAGGVSFVPELTLDRKMPAIAALIFVLAVWPGVLLTDSFLVGHFEFYQRWYDNGEGLQTWWWYVPLTVVSVVWAWFGAMKKSDKTAGASAREAMGKIAGELGGRVEARPGSE